MNTPLSHFCAWAMDQGITTALHPKESMGKGTGLFVDTTLLHAENKHTDQGELLFVPRSLLLSRSRILQLQSQPLRRTFRALGLDNLTERLAIVLFILFQRLLLEHKACAFEGPVSRDQAHDNTNNEGYEDKNILAEAQQPSLGSLFDPYISSLPDVSTPVTLDPDVTRGYLAGTLLLDSVCAKRAKLESEFELLSGKLGLFDHWPFQPSLDNFVWADATFWSRVLSFQTQWGEGQHEQAQERHTDDQHMVPFLDFANHAAKPNIRWQLDSDGLRVWAKQSLVDRMDESGQDGPHQKQDLEVFLSYGNKPNTELLFLYGFTLQENPTQFLTLAMPMDEDDPYYMPKAHTLMRLGIPPRITVYLDEKDGPDKLVELCRGLWITQESQYLLWIYSLNEEDGLGALIEEPTAMVCVPSEMEDSDGMTEEADLFDEETVGRLLLTIEGTRVVSEELLRMTVPKLEIYPVMVLRSLVLVAERIEFYINRIMETGDKVQKVEDVEIVRAVNYDADTHDDGPRYPRSGITAGSRLGHNIGDCLVPTLLEPDHEHPITSRQLEVEMQISNLVSAMKSYRTEEMSLLVRISNILGEAQTHCLEESDFIQAYLSRMQIQ